MAILDRARASATILLAEDDESLARMIDDVLTCRGYRVLHAPCAAEAESVAAQDRPDLIIVDLMLPDANGLVLCADLKARTGAPIIVCSATHRRDDAILSLKLGADDFVSKPFLTGELLARIEAALRRAGPTPSTPAPPTALSVGSLSLDLASYRATLDGRPVQFTPSEYRLLLALAERPGEVLSRQALAEQVWGYFDAQLGRTLEVHISRVRTKLANGARYPPLLVTVRGFGYKLVPDAEAEAA